MDPRERMNRLDLGVDAAISGRLTHLWTAIPVKIASYNAALQTAAVQSMIIPGMNNPITGVKQIPFPMPIINDCPVMFPGGGGFHLTFPIAVGDEGLLILASRDIDGWWGTGNASQPADLRMHDLSDGFVMVGVRSSPKALSGVSTNAVQLRSDDGVAHIEMAAGHVVNIVAPGGINITGPVNVTGSIVATGNVTGNGTSLHTHVHTGVTTGGSNTGAPL